MRAVLQLFPEEGKGEGKALHDAPHLLYSYFNERLHNVILSPGPLRQYDLSCALRPAYPAPCGALRLLLRLRSCS
jgi:hypothetical protein